MQYFLDAASAAARAEFKTHGEFIDDSSLEHATIDQPPSLRKHKAARRGQRGPTSVEQMGSNHRGITAGATTAAATSSISTASAPGADLTPPPNPWPWLVLFYDCKAHALGWCSGCDIWNTGVMIVSRPASPAIISTSVPHLSDQSTVEKGRVVRSSGSSRSTGTSSRDSDNGVRTASSSGHVTQEGGNCLKAWQEQLDSGAFPTDQVRLILTTLLNTLQKQKYKLLNYCINSTVRMTNGSFCFFVIESHNLLTLIPSFLPRVFSFLRKRLST